MTAFLLSAGNATRLDDLAPGGCKAMTIVGGQTMLDWWASSLGEMPTVVCRSDHLVVLPDNVNTVICDTGGGPARALQAALDVCDPDEPVTVAYADTWLYELPEGDEWCAVAAAPGGRSWDVVEDGFVWYGDPIDAALVCVGAYRFGDFERLARSVDDALEASHNAEVGMGEVVNFYLLPYVPAFGWQDVGDPDALGRWRALS